MGRKTHKCVHLVLSRKWFEMIEARKKKEEYRDITDYYYSRLMDPDCIFSIMNAAAAVASDPTKKTEIDISHLTNGFQIVAFHRGYTGTVMYYNVEKVTIGYGKTEWGAPSDTPVFKIYLDSQRYF